MKENLELLSISNQAFIFPKSLILYNSEGRFKTVCPEGKIMKLFDIFYKMCKSSPLKINNVFSESSFNNQNLQSPFRLW